MGYFFLLMGAGAASSAAAKAWLPRDCAAMTAGTAPEIARKFRREIELASVFMMLLLDLDLNLIDQCIRRKKQISYRLPGGLLCGASPFGLVGALVVPRLAPRPGPPPPRRILRRGGCFT